MSSRSLTGDRWWRSVLVAILATPTLYGQTSAVDPVTLTAKLDAEGFSQMLIPIRVSGQTFWCSADSGGSRVLSLDLTKARNAGLQPNATGTSAGVGPEVHPDQRLRGVTVEVGPVILRDITIVLVPRPMVVPDIDCVLGLGLLTDFVVEFDYKAPAVHLIRAAQFHPSSAAMPIPISLDRTTTPSIRARLRVGNTDALDVRLMVDTGASYYDVVLFKPFIDAHALTSRVETIVPRFSDTPGITLSAARASALNVGPFEISGPVAALISTSSAGTFTVDGLLGAGFLKRFKVTFDFAHQQVWLEPNGRTRDAQAFDASGIEVRPRANHDFVIVAVAPDSPAADAALRVGDVLKQIDGRSATRMTLGDIQNALNRVNVSCVVLIDRQGHVETATLRLRRRL